MVSPQEETIVEIVGLSAGLSILRYISAQELSFATNGSCFPAVVKSRTEILTCTRRRGGRIAGSGCSDSIGRGSCD